MTEQPPRSTNLGAALHAHYAPARQAQDATRQALTDRAKADAALHGTPAWDALPAHRKTAAQQHALNTTDTARKDTTNAA